MLHLIYMPQQEKFLEGLADKLPQHSMERLQKSNPELPPLLRLLVPAVQTMAEFREIQKDKKWLD